MCFYFFTEYFLNKESVTHKYFIELDPLILFCITDILSLDFKVNSNLLTSINLSTSFVVHNFISSTSVQ